MTHVPQCAEAGVRYAVQQQATVARRVVRERAVGPEHTEQRKVRLADVAPHYLLPAVFYFLYVRSNLECVFGVDHSDAIRKERLGRAR